MGRPWRKKAIPLSHRERDLGLQPEHDERVERAVLGSMLIREEAIYAVLSRGITRDHFYKIRHQLVFQAIVSLSETMRPVDLITLEHELREAGTLEDAGGASAVADLFDVIPTAANVGHYAEVLVRLHARRQREVDAVEGVHKLRDGEEEEAASLFQRAADGTIADRPLAPRSVQLRELAQRLQDQARGPVIGMSTGLAALDAVLGGFVRGRSYALAGRTSEGKTAVALQMALAVALGGDAVHVFSKEMSHQDLNTRLLTLLSGVPLPPGAMAKLDELRREAVAEKLRMLENVPLYVDDRDLDLTRTLAAARRLKGKVGLFVIDHARLVPVPGAESEYEAVTAVSGAAKRIAIECNAATLLVCQINREGAKSGRPALHHLQGSGALEQDADVVMLLSRNGYANPQGQDLTATLQVGKNRHGAGTVAKLVWRPALMKFEEVSPR